ncbi:MAG TPA: lysozyme [Candidatus Nanoarchaeia archaeon]|nr:lysozyme [Candidatus Nanoarchaeia archaeon]
MKKMQNFGKAFGGLVLAASSILFCARGTEDTKNYAERPPINSTMQSNVVTETSSSHTDLERIVSDVRGEDPCGEDYTYEDAKVFGSVNKGYALSERGLDLITRYEGFSPVKYLCQAGKPTIGYGHVVLKGERFGKISESEARMLLRKDVRKAERAVGEMVSVPLTQNQYDSLVSYVFNVGAGSSNPDRKVKSGFYDSTLRQKLNRGDYVGAAKEFEKWNKVNGKESNGLTKRRASEKDLFLGNIVKDTYN